jgi:thioredoxin 1
MEDLRAAKKRLRGKGFTLCIAKGEQILFETRAHGISGFLRAIEELGERLEGASAADKVVGKAVALLCLHAGIEAMYASVMSRRAKELFEENDVQAEWGELVDNILSNCEPAACPFESLAAKITDPAEAYKKLKALQESLRHADEKMSSGNERSVSDEKELERIRGRKLTELREKKQEMNNGPVHVTDSNFKDITRKHPLALIDFWAAWCGPCQALAPAIEELAKEYTGRILVGKLNVDENPQTAECFQVFSIPTMLIMKNGEEIDRIVGCVQKNYIEAALRKHLE